MKPAAAYAGRGARASPPSLPASSNSSRACPSRWHSCRDGGAPSPRSALAQSPPRPWRRSSPPPCCSSRFPCSSGSSTEQRAAGPSRRRQFRRAAAAGWWFGFGYFLLGLFWIGEAFLVEADNVRLADAVRRAAHAGRAGAVHGLGRRRGAPCLAAQRLARVLVLAIALASAEWLRGHVLTGFPWNVLGYALTSPLELMQAASLFGIYGLTLLCVAIFAAPARRSSPVRSPARRLTAAFCGRSRWPSCRCSCSTGWAPGGLSGEPRPCSTMRASASCRRACRSATSGGPKSSAEIFEDQLALSRRNAAGRQDDLAGITHLIWPEAAMPFLPLEHPEALAAIGDYVAARHAADIRRAATEEADARIGRRRARPTTA